MYSVSDAAYDDASVSLVESIPRFSNPYGNA